MHSEHTPGPWSIREGTWIEGPDGTLVSSEGASFTEADARLIAAAPDLLEALKVIHYFFTNEESYPDIIRIAGTAIAKARGSLTPE